MQKSNHGERASAAIHPFLSFSQKKLECGNRAAPERTESPAAKLQGSRVEGLHGCNGVCRRVVMRGGGKAQEFFFRD